MSTVTLTVNGQTVAVPAGSTILEAAEHINVAIPTFCHDPSLPGVASCRICVVEVKGSKKLTPACMTVAKEGMEVETESAAVVEARKTILELILANHPMDCMTCDKNGACKLQDYAFQYNVKDTGFAGEKHQYDLEDDNPYIIRDMNKCILCGKCVRTCAAADRNIIDFAYRGFKTKVAPPMDVSLGESYCVYCGRCVTVCPVGALTVKSLAGKGRTWEIEQRDITCTFCEKGCSFKLNLKHNKVLAVTPGAPAEGRPLCLKGRLGLELLHCEEPIKPQLKKDGQFVEVSWAEALGLNKVLDKINNLEGK